MTQFSLSTGCSLIITGRRFQILSQNQQERQRSSEQLERVFAEWARLRLQKQIHQQHQLKQQHHHQRPPLSSLNYPQEVIGPGFSFLYPAVNTKNIEDAPQNPNEPYEFAVQPFDSRYYEPSVDRASDSIDDIAARYENGDYNIDPNSMIGDVFSNNNHNTDDSGAPSDSLIPPPMHVHGENKQQPPDRILHRNQVKQKNVQQQQDVMQKPLQVDFDSTMSLYIVALIAGLSCAFSTGVSRMTSSLKVVDYCENVTFVSFLFINSTPHLQLIALGLMYWTLYKKSKSGNYCLLNFNDVPSLEFSIYLCPSPYKPTRVTTRATTV